MQLLIANAARALQDPDHVRWSLLDLYDYANQAMMELIRHRPDVGTQNRTLQLVEGTRQAVPANCQQLIRLVRSVPSNRAVRYIAAESLDALMPSWQASKKSDQVREYCWKEDEPKIFWVYPPAKAGARVEGIVSEHAPVMTPPAEGELAPAFPLPSHYRDIIQDGILFHAFDRNTDGISLEKAAYHYQRFQQGLGIQQQGKMRNSPAPRRQEPES